MPGFVSQSNVWTDPIDGSKWDGWPLGDWIVGSLLAIVVLIVIGIMWPKP